MKAKKVTAHYLVESRNHVISYDVTISRTSKLAFADWIWYGKDMLKESYNEEPVKIIIEL